MAGRNLVYMNIDASIKRFCVQWGEPFGLAYEDFDAHADDSTVPQGDLIGTSGLALSTDYPFQNAHVMIGITTQNDTNLLRLRELVAELYNRLQPLKTIPVLDFEDVNSQMGLMIVQDGVHILPVGGEQARPLQYIMLTFKTDCFSG